MTDRTKAWLLKEAADRKKTAPNRIGKSVSLSDKFRYALAVLRSEGASSSQLARTDLEASWAIRCESETLPDALGISGHDEWTTVGDIFAYHVDEVRNRSQDLDSWEAEIRASLATLDNAKVPEAERTYALWRLRVHGENVEVVRALSESNTGGANVSGDLGRLRSALLASIEDERGFQREYISHSLTDNTSGTDRGLPGWPNYCRGEVFRRLGEHERVISEYESALRAGVSYGMFRTCVRRLQERGFVIDRKVLTEYQETMIACLSTMMTKSADFAAEELADSNIPEATRALVNALESSIVDTRRAAASGLRRVREPNSRVIDALGRHVQDSDDWIGLSCTHALTLYPDETVVPFLRVAVRSRNRLTRETAVLGLGCLGDESDAVRILDADVFDYFKLLAISALTNSAQGTLGDAREWLASRSAGKREDWAREGLLEMGYVRGAGVQGGLDRLIDLVTSNQYYVRVNAIRELMKVTGKHLGWEAITDHRKNPAGRIAAAEEWRKWSKKSGR